MSRTHVKRRDPMSRRHPVPHTHLPRTYQTTRHTFPTNLRVSRRMCKLCVVKLPDTHLPRTYCLVVYIMGAPYVYGTTTHTSPTNLLVSRRVCTLCVVNLPDTPPTNLVPRTLIVYIMGALYIYGTTRHTSPTNLSHEPTAW